MPDLINVSVSALKATQIALSTTMHNLSNSGTEGYSRQVVDFTTRIPQYGAGGYHGSGVEIAAVKRIASDFINTTMNETSSAFHSADTYYKFASQLDDLMSDSAISLPESLNQFFSAISNAANDPSSIPARQVFLSRAEILAARMNEADTRLKKQMVDLNSNVQQAVAQINSLGESIAALNVSISESLGASAGKPPNDLLDERDLLLKKLSELTSISTVDENDGTVSVFIGKNQNFVLKNLSYHLSTAVNIDDASLRDVVYGEGKSSSIITGNLSGGILGGLYDFRDEVLIPTQNALNRLAVGMSYIFNEQHTHGIDLNGNLGGNLFHDVNAYAQKLSRVAASDNNHGNASIALTIDDLESLKLDNYKLTYDGTYYNLTNFATGALEQRSNTISGITGFGFSLTLLNGSAVTGDEFIIRPAMDGARLMACQITDPRALALASPIRITGSNSNAGNGKISDLTITNTSGSPVPTAFIYGNSFGSSQSLTPPLQIRFIDATTYQIYDMTTPPGTKIGPDQTYDATTGVTVFPLSDVTDSTPPGPNPDYTWDPGYHFRITGAPIAGDVFNIEFNTDGTSDNQNAMLLLNMRTTQNMIGGTASITDTYAQMVSTVGNRTQAAKTAQVANDSLLQQVTAQREAISGVNNEEEAGFLLKYQQAYAAAARVLATAKELFDVLISTFR